MMDVDGTLTDGKIYMGSSGEIMKAFSIKDGCGIHDILIPNGITPIIITSRKSDIVMNRCLELGIKEVYQSVGNKLEQLNSIVDDLSKCAYIGDDINDLICIEAVNNAGGVTGCPANAAKILLEYVDYVSSYCGGDGAVRDFIEFIISRCLISDK